MSAETIVNKTIIPRPIPERRAAAPLFKRTMDAFAWRFMSESSRFALQLAVMIVLARLLPVESFGLLTLSMIVIDFASRAQLGVSSAVVQRNEITETHIRVAFSLSVLSGIILAMLIWLGAPLAAALFRAEAVTQVLRLISLSFLFTSFGSIAEALLERNLNYRSLFKVEICSYGIGYCLVGISLAFFDYGVWALAWATVVYSLLKTGLLFSVCPHQLRPSLMRSESVKLLRFGTGTSLARLASFAAANGDYFVVGRWLGAAALGLYSRAFQLMSLPMYQFSSVINYVLFPAYAKIQNDTDRLRRAYIGSVSLSFLVILPALTTLAIGAPDLIVGFLGAQWTDATLPLQILCIGGVFQCTYNLGDSLARAKGAVYWKFCCHTVYALCVILASLIGTRWGITGVAVGVVIAMSVIYLLMAQLSIYLTRATWKEFFLSQVPGVIIGASVAGISLPVTVMLRATQLPHLAIVAISLTVSLVTAVITGSLLSRSWLDGVSHGSIEKARNYYWEISKLIEPLRFVKLYLRQNKTAFGIALIPYRFYENIVYLFLTTREGLWRRIVMSNRELRKGKSQAVITWDVPLPCCNTPAELMNWFSDHSIEVREGGHTFYIPPQPGLEKILPTIVNFYPARSGFKILKDFGHPKQTRYFYKHRKSLFVLGMLIGTPAEQVITASYLYSLGVGPKVYDLTCWRSSSSYYTVFVVEHAGEKSPNEAQYEYSMDRLHDLHSHSRLRILIPGWKWNEDFMPPNCNSNLVFSETRGRALYVDFQNFGITSTKDWRSEIILEGGLEGTNGSGNGNHNSLVSSSPSQASGSGTWKFVVNALRNN
ncbi:MAG TPA: lipopolysaccharide biosynthesis protein, partial [Pyrinomonadaceae bacterium]